MYVENREENYADYELIIMTWPLSRNVLSPSVQPKAEQ